MDQFKQFCVETKYMDVKGREKDNYHIDRIDENKGYHIDNIQILTNTENVKKYFDHYYDESVMKYVFKYQKVKQTEDNAPF